MRSGVVNPEPLNPIPETLYLKPLTLSTKCSTAKQVNTWIEATRGTRSLLDAESTSDAETTFHAILRADYAVLRADSMLS